MACHKRTIRHTDKNEKEEEKPKQASNTITAGMHELSFGMHVTSALNCLLIVVKVRKMKHRRSVNSRHRQKWCIHNRTDRCGTSCTGRHARVHQTSERTHTAESDHVKITRQYITCRRVKRPKSSIFMNAPATRRIHTQKRRAIYKSYCTIPQNSAWINDRERERDIVCMVSLTKGSIELMLFARSAHDNSKYQNNKNTENCKYCKRMNVHKNESTATAALQASQQQTTTLAGEQHKKKSRTAESLFNELWVGWLAFNFILYEEMCRECTVFLSFSVCSVFSVIFFSFCLCVYSVFRMYFLLLCLVVVFFLFSRSLVFLALFTFITAMCAELNMITAFKQLQFHTKLVTAKPVQ